MRIYIWFSLVLLPCLAYENYGNSFISLERNGITESEFRVLEQLGTIEPLLLLVLVPLVIAWIGASGFLTLILVTFSYDSPHQPGWFPLPIRFIVFFIGSLFASPMLFLQNIPQLIQNHFDTPPRHDYYYDSVQ